MRSVAKEAQTHGMAHPNSSPGGVEQTLSTPIGAENGRCASYPWDSPMVMGITPLRGFSAAREMYIMLIITAAKAPK